MTSRVVVLGGGFCGIVAAKRLEKYEKVDLTLIDEKSYFEYTPGIHEVVFDPYRYQKVIAPFEDILDEGKFVKTEVSEITPRKLIVRDGEMDFDYLAICTGARYPIPIGEKDVVKLTSLGDALELSKKIESSEKVLIIGGGPIGTEVAGEIVTKKPRKEVKLVHLGDRLLERIPEKASEYTEKFLRGHGADIFLDEKITDHQEGKFVTEKGREVDADIGIWCGGIQPNAGFLSGFEEFVFSEKGALKTSPHLNLPGYSNIFAGGDVNDVREEKTAYNADRHGHLISENIIRSVEGEDLLSYEKRSYPMLLSLGSRDGTLSYSKWTLSGLVPRIMKGLVQYWTMGKLENGVFLNLERLFQRALFG